MPWNIVSNDGRCPASKPYAVVGGRTGNGLFGCHPDRASARKQQQALYAQADDTRQDDDDAAPAGPAAGPADDDDDDEDQEPDNDADDRPSAPVFVPVLVRPGPAVPKGAPPKHHKKKHEMKQQTYPPVCYTTPDTVAW